MLKLADIRILDSQKRPKIAVVGHLNYIFYFYILFFNKLKSHIFHINFQLIRFQFSVLIFLKQE